MKPSVLMLSVFASIITTGSVLGAPVEKTVRPGPARAITPDDTISPSFFPDGKRLAYVQQREGGSQELWVADMASGKTTRIGNIDSVQSPAVSPDGRWIAYLAGQGLVRQLWLVDPSHPQPRQITLTRTMRTAPVWTDGGKRLAYATGMGRTQRVVSVDPFAKDPLETPVPGLAAGQPAFSADGKLVALTAPDSRGRLNVKVFSRAGKLLFATPPMEGPAGNTRGCYGPAFSPNNSCMVYVRSGIQPYADLYLHDLKTNRETALTGDQFDNQMPAFSPDGRSLAFVAAKNGQRYRIWLMALEETVSSAKK